MSNTKKLVVDIPYELSEMLTQTSEKQMITKTAVVKLAVQKYCKNEL